MGLLLQFIGTTIRRSVMRGRPADGQANGVTRTSGGEKRVWSGGSLCRCKSTMVSGPDDVPSMYVKKFAHCLAEPLTCVYSFSFQLGAFSQAWKDANVVPIYKGKGNRSDPNSYRDVSIISNLAKPMEYQINRAIVKFCEVNRLFSPDQHAFLRGKSTITNLLSCLHDWVTALTSNSPIPSSLYLILHILSLNLF